MTDQIESDRDPHTTDDQPKPGNPPYNINGPRTAEPEDYDEDDTKKTERGD